MQCLPEYKPYTAYSQELCGTLHLLEMVMGNPGLVRGPDLEVAVHNVAEPVTLPKTGLNTGRT
jgi:hypothetical protein